MTSPCERFIIVMLTTEFNHCSLNSSGADEDDAQGFNGSSVPTTAKCSAGLSKTKGRSGIVVVSSVSSLSLVVVLEGDDDDDDDDDDDAG
jgi:hypothetical protein